MRKFLLLLFYIVPSLLFSQSESSESAETMATELEPRTFEMTIAESEAEFEFYQGVNLFHSGNIPLALLAFQKAISFSHDSEKNPDEAFQVLNPLIYKFWFAKANYAYGNPEISEVLWRELIMNEFLPSYLRNMLEILQMRKQNIDTFQFSQMSRATSINLIAEGLELPMSLRTLRDGSIGLTGLKSNIVAIFNPTGVISRFLVKNYESFNIPTDIVQLSNGTLLVTEFQSNTISQFTANGNFSGEFIPFDNEKNTSLATNFIGPQYLAIDKFDNVYVSVYGTGEIIKLSVDGNFLLRFGKETSAFNGLQSPRGIAIENESVWVADETDYAAQLVEFDTSGNYLGSFSFPIYKNIESLRLLNANTLLVTFHENIIKFSTERKTILEELSDSEFDKLLSSDLDINGLLWITDQARNRIDIFTNISSLYTGLQLNILRIDTRNFPKLKLFFSVKNSSGRSITGLHASSLAITEANQPISSYIMQESSEIDRDTNLVLVPGMLSNTNDLVLKERLKDSVRIVTENALTKAKENAQVHLSLIVPNPGIPHFPIEKTNLASKLLTFIDDIPFDDIGVKDIYAALRFACNVLLQRDGNKAVIFVGNIGAAHDLELWNSLSATLEHHNITLYWVNSDFVGKQVQYVLDADVEYFSSIVTQSGGLKYQYPFILHEAEISIIDELFSPDYGEYTVEFTSRYTKLSPKQYVPVILTGYFYNNSGQDINGYVLPGFDN